MPGDAVGFAAEEGAAEMKNLRPGAGCVPFLVGFLGIG
jgi:hypothetical protein